MPSFAITLAVASIGFADSINPSTVVPALYLAGAPRGRGLASFTLGVFVVYLAGGIVLVLGPGPALIDALRAAGPGLRHAGEAVVGLGALVLAIGLWRGAPAAASRPLPAPRRATAFALGAGISAIELPTAFLYFGALSAILGSHAAPAAQISLVIAYNAVFVLPLVLMVALRSRLEGRIAALVRWLCRVAGRVLAVAFGAAGLALVASGLIALATA